MSLKFCKLYFIWYLSSMYGCLTYHDRNTMNQSGFIEIRGSFHHKLFMLHFRAKTSRCPKAIVKLNCHICNLMRCMSTCPCFRMFWVPTIFDFSFNRLKAPVMFKVCLRYRHCRFDHPKPKVRLNCCPEHLRLSHVSLATKLQERQLHG